MKIRTVPSWLSIIAPGVGGAALLATAAALLRHGFVRRMEALQRSSEQALPASTRTDLPAEAIDLARRLEAFGCRGGRLVRLTQSGEMRLRPGAKPLAFTARQTIALAEVRFFWRALFRVSGLPMQVVDYLIDGQGGLQVQLLDLLPVVRHKGGSAMFRGEAMRYLAELMWAPDAMLVNPQLDRRVMSSRIDAR